MQLIGVLVYIRQLPIDQLIPIDVAGLELFIDRSVLVSLSLMTLTSHWIRMDFLLADIDPTDEFPASYGPHRKDALTI